MATLVHTEAREATQTSIFARVLVGVDGSPESAEAAKQAAIVTHGPLTLLTAFDIVAPIVGATGSFVPAHLDVDLQRARADEILARALCDLGHTGAESRVARGSPWESLMREARRSGGTLIVVGSHGVGRARGLLLGSTVTQLVHRAPCSVLVARGYARAPDRIIVGVDGSPESMSAYRAARELSDRFDATLRPLAAPCDDIDINLLEVALGERVREVMDDPVHGIVTAADGADLVVVGSRGLQGLKALGSVSERVAHQARCPVLIVRHAPWQRVEEAEVAAE